MRLGEFELAEALPGKSYELGRGVINVVDVPDRKHFAQVDCARQQLSAYRVEKPEQIYRIAGGGECKILLADLESERHPDLAVYKSPPPQEDAFWAAWLPEIVVEVVSPGSETRDYVEKREEYLQFGVREYWIIDFDKRQMLALRRSRGKWVERIVRPGDAYHTSLLPGFELDLARIFREAENA
jgi:Uma2 family endonuclease